jgi:hypothetical protein
VLVGLRFERRIVDGPRGEERSYPRASAWLRRVFDPQDPRERHVNPGFFEGLSERGFGQRLARLDATGRKIPALTVLLLVHDREAMALLDEHHREEPRRVRISIAHRSCR